MVLLKTAAAPEAMKEGDISGGGNAKVWSSDRCEISLERGCGGHTRAIEAKHGRIGAKIEELKREKRACKRKQDAPVPKPVEEGHVLGGRNAEAPLR